MNPSIKEISVQELKQWIDSNKDFQLVDVREVEEVQAANLGGLHIPIGQVMMRQSEIETDKPVAFLCRSGRRSELAVLQLQQFGFSDLYNITGGIMAYSQLVDTTLKPI